VIEVKLVFQFPAEKKAELTKLLEADPYEKVSFPRNGYKLKDGTSVSEDPKKAYLYLSCTEEFAKFAHSKLDSLSEKIEPAVSERVIKKIEEEENSAEAGFGAIFG